MSHQDTIYIIGAGAIGKVLAALLTLEQKKVVIIRGSIDDYSKGTENIEVEMNGTQTLAATVEISTLSNFTTLNGIIVCTSKSFGNQLLSKALRTKSGNSPLVILQNGLDVEQPFIANGFTHIYRSVLFATSQPVAPNKFRFKPVEASPIGMIKGNTATLDMVVRGLNNHYFEFVASANIGPLVWTKTIVNCVFNSVCPLLETDNGIFHRDENALNLAKELVAECIGVARKAGIAIEFDKVMDKLLLISNASDGQLISTYQDIINKRETEIESLNLSIVKIAKDLNLGNAVTQTSLLGELIKLKSVLTRRN